MTEADSEGNQVPELEWLCCGHEPVAYESLGLAEPTPHKRRRHITHPVPLMVDSPCSLTLHARTAILGRDGDTWFRVRSLGRISRPRSQHQAPPFGFSFPPPGPAGPVPRLRRYYEGAATPCRHPAALRFLRLAVPRMHSLLSLSGGRVRRQSRELVTRYLQPGIRRGANRVLPSSWGTTDCPFAHVPIRRRQDCLHQTTTVQQRGPWYPKSKGSHEGVFRRSIAWLSDSLSTLRRASYPTTTQDSLPVAGQALPDGLSTRKVPMKGFRFASYISFPFPKLLAAITSTEAS